jgi:hypothetical protein
MHFTMKDMIPYLMKLGQTDIILCALQLQHAARYGNGNTSRRRVRLALASSL